MLFGVELLVDLQLHAQFLDDSLAEIGMCLSFTIGKDKHQALPTQGLLIYYTCRDTRFARRSPLVVALP